ncbi:MAG: division/cell wall cluster transcriptional repressor MraZ [Patescibacteria group bacterium]|nr:division/cell wall cluster transcriptional repressor MraZ [Patescibacteria group bacterium]
MVFFGEYRLSFTSPGRLVLPKKIRELIKGDTFVLSKGFDHCLSGYDREDWEKRARSFFNFSLIDRDNLPRQRFLFSSIVYLEIDAQGRFVIPRHLLVFAQLENQALIIGVGDHFEIWNPKKWQIYQKKHF